MRLGRMTLIFVAIGAALAGAPPSASAQVIMDCGKCTDETEGTDSHIFAQEGATVACTSSFEDPEEIDECHDDQAVYGVCTQIHGHCTSEEDAETIARSIDRFDALGTAMRILEAGHSASYSEEVGYVEVRCGDTLVARLEVPLALRRPVDERIQAVREVVQAMSMLGASGMLGLATGV